MVISSNENLPESYLTLKGTYSLAFVVSTAPLALKLVLMPTAQTGADCMFVFAQYVIFLICVKVLKLEMTGKFSNLKYNIL